MTKNPVFCALLLVIALACSPSPAAPGHDGPASGANSVPTTKPSADAEAVVAKVKDVLPKGWAIAGHGNWIEIERDEPVQVFNAVGLQMFRSRDEARRYVEPHVRSERFRITLQLDDRLTDEQYAKIEAADEEVKSKAGKAIAGQKIVLIDYLRSHPEYGYRELPMFDTGNRSIYVSVSLHGGFEALYSDDVRRECQGVRQRLCGLFRAYDEKSVTEFAREYDALTAPHVHKRSD